MLITLLIIAVVLLALTLVPLIIYGDAGAVLKRDSIIWAAGAIGLFVAVLINLLAEKFPRRYDLTAEKKYSVSTELQNVMNKLDDQAKITYYAFSPLQEFIALKRDMLDKLGEIKNASKGKIDLEVVNVDMHDKALVKELDEKGFQLRFDKRGKDEVSSAISYSGLKITYKDKETEYIQQALYPQVLELELATKLIPWTITEKPVIAIDMPPGRPGRPQFPGDQSSMGDYDWLRQGFVDPKRFEVKYVDLTENNSIPPNAKLLLLLRPKELNDRQRYEVVKFLAQGGAVFYLASPIKMSSEMGTFRAEKTPTGLENYLKEFGVAMSEDFLADRSHLSPGVYFNGQLLKISDDPFHLQIRPEFINQESSLTQRMPGMVMPNATELMLDDKVLAANNLTKTVLASTTEQTWIVSFSPNVNPENELETEEGPAKKFVGSKPIFAMIKGQFPFPYEGKPIPEWPSADAPKDKDKDKDKKPAGTATVTKKEGTLVICTAPDAFAFSFLTNKRIGQMVQSSNLPIMTNLSESMSMGDDLIKLRSKRYETRALKGLSGSSEDKESKRLMWKILLVSQVPVAMLIFAVYYFVFRRVNQLRYERNYAGTTGPSSFSS